MTEELVAIADFIKEAKNIQDSIDAMEEAQFKAIGYAQRIGEILNEAERDYKLFYADKLSDLKTMEEETETTRKAKLESWTAHKKYELDVLKTLKTSLKALHMSLMQAVKTRREEPRNFSRP